MSLDCLFEDVIGIDSSIDVVIVRSSLILLSFAIGLFNANAIQFGFDQLLEANTDELVCFVHWYYKLHEIGRLINLYFITGSMAYLSDRNTYLS